MYKEILTVCVCVAHHLSLNSFMKAFHPRCVLFTIFASSKRRYCVVFTLIVPDKALLPIWL